MNNKKILVIFCTIIVIISLLFVTKKIYDNTKSLNKASNDQNSQDGESYDNLKNLNDNDNSSSNTNTENNTEKSTDDIKRDTTTSNQIFKNYNLDSSNSVYSENNYNNIIESSNNSVSNTTDTTQATNFVKDVKPVLIPNTTDLTNSDVTITIIYSTLENTIKEYSLDGTTWITYTAPITISTNITIYAREKDSYGNVSKIESIDITNIDKTIPTTPVLTSNTTDLTNQDVTLTIAYSDDSITKKYSLNGTEWLTYTVPVTISTNGTVYARGIDLAGNISEVGEIEVTNIDKTIPTTPVLTPNTTDLTNQDVTLTIAYSDDSITKEYSLNGTEWLTYTEPVTISTNEIVYARGIDLAGNISEVGEIEVTNIDKTIPTTPVLTLSTTDWTNQDVTLTIAYSDDSITKEYSLNGTDWLTYTVPVTISTNGTVYARGKNSSGKTSSIGEIEITNIDKTIPTISFGTNGGNISNTASTTVTVSDSGSGVNTSTLQYVWGGSTAPSSGWKAFTNGGTLSKSIQSDSEKGEYYLWIKAGDNSNNTEPSASKAFYITYDLTAYSVYLAADNIIVDCDVLNEGMSTALIHLNVNNSSDIKEVKYSITFDGNEPSDTYITAPDFATGKSTFNIYIENIPSSYFPDGGVTLKAKFEVIHKDYTEYLGTQTKIQ